MKRLMGVAGVLLLYAVVSTECCAVDTFSFEDGTLQNWFSEGLNFDPDFGELSSATVVTSAPGVPTDWVDGTHFVELTNQFPDEGFHTVFFGPGSVESEPGSGVYDVDVTKQALLANTTLEVDFWVPTSSLAGRSFVRLDVQIEGSSSTVGKQHVRTSISGGSQNGMEGKHYHVSWNYAEQFEAAEKPISLAADSYLQVKINIQSFFTGDVSDPEIAFSPFYMDNFVLSGAPDPVLHGDFNGDGLVNLADYTVWRNNLGTTEDDAVLAGNGDGIGVVDNDDYVLWKTSFGNAEGGVGAVTSPVAVPEPGTLAVGLIALGLLVGARHRSDQFPLRI